MSHQQGKRMTKQQRVNLFHAHMRLVLPSASPQEAWRRMSEALASVEDIHAPPGETPMTILALSHRDVRSYGEGGFAIPLLGYRVFLNANGAIAIHNDYEGGAVFLTMPGADHVPFEPVPGWKYAF